LRQREFNRSARQVLDYNLQQIRDIEGSPATQQGAIEVREAGVRPTGVVGRFQYFSHFYTPPQARRGGR
jgi:hypothetical protein